MSFKRVVSDGTSWAALVFAAWAYVTITGCGPKHLPAPSGLPMGNDPGLVEAGPALVRFFDGGVSAFQAASPWESAIRSLTLFSERTQGAREGVYTPQELRAFLEKYFLEGIKIPDALLAEAMQLKRVMLGGSLTELTRADLRSAVALLGVVRDEALALRAFMPLTAAGMKGRTPEQVDAAVRAMRAAAVKLGERLDSTGVPYSFERMNALATALRDFQGAKASPRLAQFQEKLPLIQALKSLLIAPEANRIGGSEWGVTLTTLADWYGLGLRYAAMPDKSLGMTGEGRERLMPLVRGAMELIDQALSRQPREQIAFARLDQLIDLALPEQGLAVTNLRVVTRAHLKDFLRPLVQRFMGGSDASYAGRKALGMTRSAWARLRARFEHWNDGQSYLDAAFAQAGDSKIRSVALSVGQLRSMRWVGKFESPSPRMADAIARIQQVLRLDRPLFGGTPGQIQFGGHRHDGLRTHYDLTQANWTYELARLLMDGYADDPAQAARGNDLAEVVSFPAFERFVGDITPIGVDVKVIDPLDPLLAIKRFREASLFTYAGTGSGRISVQQAAQLLALMVSGKRLALQIHQESIDAGCKRLGPDPFGFDYIDPACYRRNFFGQPDHFWANMPKLAEYYKTLNGRARIAFETHVETGARKLGFSPQPINSSDSEGFAIIGQYVEVIFSRFDADDSGALDWYEAEGAFPIFQGSLHEISCQQGHCLDSEADLYAVFTYMLAHGKAPGTAAFLRWRYLPAKGGLNADRGRLIQIFGELGKPKTNSG